MEIEKKEKEITAEELQLYDRQRFIGMEVQKRLLNAVVFLSPLNGINTELAKNLILSGTNIAIADNEKINQDDVESNFLVAPADLGQNRGQTIGKKLKEMNPMVKIDIFDSFDIEKYNAAYYQKDGSEYQGFSNGFLDQFNVIATSVKSFKQMKIYEQVCNKLNTPYYNLLCCGFSGFYYVNLGSEFDFIKKKPVTQTFKNGKMVAQDDGYEHFERVTIKGVPLEKTFDSRKNRKTIFKAIQAMEQAEKQNIVYDCFNPNQEVLDKIIELAKKICQFKDQEIDALTKFIKFYGIEYCPVYSVIGSVASQEFIKVIGKDKEPGINWFLYDSQDGYGKIENIQGENSYSKEDVPELKRKIEVDEA